ncbi:flavodoxin [Marinilabiliaceae bacterium JC017]|nr:flavodoxin [Marinilabiliaceae bacterium JC017]
MANIGIFFGPEKGSVEKAARKIAQEFGEEKADLIPVKGAEVVDLEKYDKLVFGLSTIGKTNWDSEHKDIDWDVFSSKLKSVNWTNKSVAIYSLGDQITYPQHFVDAIGWMYDRLMPLDVKVVGFVDPEGYKFEASEGFRNGLFMGLPLDEDTESDKTDVRISHWVSLLVNEFGF